MCTVAHSLTHCLLWRCHSQGFSVVPALSHAFRSSQPMDAIREDLYMACAPWASRARARGDMVVVAAVVVIVVVVVVLLPLLPLLALVV